MKQFLAIILFIGLYAPSTAQTFDKQKMDSFFNALAANDRAMGSVALAKNGKIIYSRAVGAAEIANDKRTPATLKTKYRIGSVTKMFTAALIFQLIDAKKLSLTTPLSNYYPMVPNAKDITIGMMLQHRSGIHSFTDDETYKKWQEQPKSKLQMLANFAASGSDFKPDSMSAYSNTNFVLLGYILEDIYAKPYATILKEQITTKAGLKDTYYGGKIQPKNNEAISYQYDKKWTPAFVTDMSIPGGAGAIVSTPEDLTRFITLLFNGKIISKESLEQMQQIKGKYGMGMLGFPFGPKKFFGHTGGIDAFASIVGYNKADSLAYAYISNGTRYSTNNIGIGVLSIYYGRPFNIPDFKTVDVSEADLNQYPGVYTNPKLPISITITKEGTTLKAQATGQPPLELEATGKDQFAFEQAGAVIKFNPAKSELVLEQRGAAFTFTRAADK